MTDSRPETARHHKRRARTWVILALIALWGAALSYRMEIRAYWWVHRLQGAATPEERRYYTLCLASIRDSSLHALPRLLKDTRPEIRVLGLEVLRDCQSSAARDLLLGALHDDSDAVVARAALMLSLRRDRAIILPLLKKDRLSGNPRVASAAMLAIERIGGPTATYELLGDLSPCSDPNLLAQAMDCLANLGGQSELRFLISMLTDPRPVTVPPFSYRMAVEAISRLQDGSMAEGVDREALLAATQAPPTVGAAAVRALYRITGQSFGDPATRPAEEARAIQSRWLRWHEGLETGGNAATSAPG